jgi:ankyrin repeat protein
MSGGINVIILGTNFTTDMVVTFGGRPAQLVSVNETALACLLPPSSVPGPVELKVQDSNVSAVTKFVYNGVTQETMELAVRVRDRGPGANGNETATGSSGTQQSNGTGTGTNGISNQAQSGSNPTQTNSLQTTLTDYIASIDEPSPGSLRHSGAINTRNDVQQTLVHLATVLGYEKLLRHLLVYGAQLDIPDVNGFTPLAFAAYCGQISCARVLIQAGATYDVPTYMGEFPLDLARSAGNTAIEQLLLSAVWSTASTSSAVPEGVGESLEAVKVPHGDDNDQSCNEVEDDLYSSDDDDEYAVETDIELDSDNPSDESDDDVDAFDETAPSRRPSKHKGTRPRIVAPDNTSIRANAPTSIRNSMSEEIDSGDESEDSAHDAFKLSPRPRRRSRRSESSNSADKVLLPSPTIDTPPPYSPATWRDKFPLTEQWKIPIAPQPLASMFYPRAADMPTDGAWITLPVSTPSWETLQKLTSPEEVKAFTQAMTAAALNAIISSGATTATTTSSTPSKPRKRRSGRRSSGSGSASARATATLATGTENATATSTTTTVSVKVETASSTTSKVIKPIKRKYSSSRCGTWPMLRL